MKKLILTLGLAAMALSTFAQNKEKIKQQAQKMAEATMKGDYDQLINGTYQPLVKLSGGHAAMVQALKRGIGEMKAQGVSFEAVSVGEPGDVKTIGKRKFCLVPQSITMRIKDGTLLANSYLLAISDDNGGHWSFVDTSNSGNIYKLFPEIKDKIVIPERQQPVFTPNKS